MNVSNFRLVRFPDWFYFPNLANGGCTGCAIKTRTQFVLRIYNTTTNAEIKFARFTLTLHSASKETVTSQNILRVFECSVEFDQATNRLRHAQDEFERMAFFQRKILSC